jgi:hypothetical protein
MLVTHISDNLSQNSTDKDDVMPRERQVVREILFEYFRFRKVPYECLPLEFADGIQSLPIRFFA